ncbi:MAG: hypothetical protein DRI69_04640, partial [Bacteroidetes bacterium]
MRLPLLSLLCAGLYACIAPDFLTSTNYSKTKSRLFSAAVILLGLLVSSTNLTAQDTHTTVQAGDWNDASTWDDFGIPNPIIKNFTEVFIKHEVSLTGSAISIRKGELKMFEGGQLTLTDADFELRPNGILTLSDGSLYMNNGQVDNNGTVNLTNGYFEIGVGDVINVRNISFDSACVRLLSGDWNNNSSGNISGTDGNIEAQNGSISNNATWGSGINYCASGSTTGSFPNPEDCDAVELYCDCQSGGPCAEPNPDILPGYQGEGDIVSPGLISLLLGNVNENLLDELFIFSLDTSDVLIDVNFIDNVAGYNGALDILDNYVSLTSIIYNGFTSTSSPSNFLTLFFPIADLIDLDTTVAHQEFINFVQQTSPSQTNSDFIAVTGSALPNQGDFAQETYLTRLGYGLDGSGTRVGILSDSYDQGGAGDASVDVDAGFLPGDSNHVYPQPVVVVKDLPLAFGPGIDEGRAMAQIVHSVAPAAEIYFHTAFEGPGPMAEAVVDLWFNDSCNIITDDITQPTQPFFGPGLVSKAIDSVTAQGVEYYTSAGNFSDRAYSATYNDLGGFHDFGGGNNLQHIDLGVGEFFIVLQWEDSFYSIDGAPGAASDFDIFLADDFGVPIYGFNKNNIGADPVEIMPFYVVNPTTTNIKIQRVSGSGTPKLKYIVYKAGNMNQGFTPLDG